MYSKSHEMGKIKYVVGQHWSLPPGYAGREGEWEHCSGKLCMFILRCSSLEGKRVPSCLKRIKPLSIFPVCCLDIERGYSFSRAVSFRQVNQHF